MSGIQCQHLHTSEPAAANQRTPSPHFAHSPATPVALDSPAAMRARRSITFKGVLEQGVSFRHMKHQGGQFIRTHEICTSKSFPFASSSTHTKHSYIFQNRSRHIHRFPSSCSHPANQIHENHQRPAAQCRSPINTCASATALRSLSSPVL